MRKKLIDKCFYYLIIIKTKDDKGHQRFTGAFTGGLKVYDIGYKGTCGSEEGFAPKNFVSSRSNRCKHNYKNIKI